MSYYNTVYSDQYGFVKNINSIGVGLGFGNNPRSGSSLDISGNVDISNGNISLFGNIGVNTNNPLSSIHINRTDAIIIPVGTELEKPNPAVRGMVRFNTTLNQFEGYGIGNSWGSLGGVIDIDQDTKILAEQTSDDDTLRFYTSGIQRLTINSVGNIDISGSINLDNTLNVTGNTTLTDVSATNLDLTGNIKNPGMIFAEMQGTIMDTMTKKGKKVKKGDSLFVLEAMKMENVITAPIDGVIKKYNIEKGQPVKKGELLVEIEVKF